MSWKWLVIGISKEQAYWDAKSVLLPDMDLVYDKPKEGRFGDWENDVRCVGPDNLKMDCHGLNVDAVVIHVILLDRDEVKMEIGLSLARKGHVVTYYEGRYKFYDSHPENCQCQRGKQAED